MNLASFLCRIVQVCPLQKKQGKANLTNDLPVGYLIFSKIGGFIHFAVVALANNLMINFKFGFGQEDFISFVIATLIQILSRGIFRVKISDAK